MRLSPFFPVVGSVEVSGSFIDRLTNPPKGANFKPSRYKGAVRPFLEPPRQAAGEVYSIMRKVSKKIQDIGK